MGTMGTNYQLKQNGQTLKTWPARAFRMDRVVRRQAQSEALRLKGRRAMNSGAAALELSINGRVIRSEQIHV